MSTNLLLNVSLRYWQDFQDSLAKILNANIYIFDTIYKPFSNLSQDVEICQKVNRGNKICNERCLNFYRESLSSLEDKGTFTCPYGINLYIYTLGKYVQKIGYLIVAFTEEKSKSDTNLASRAFHIYQAINEVLMSIIEKNLLGLRRLELSSIYEISRLLTSVTELEKVIDLITNSLIILYNAEAVFIGLYEGGEICIEQIKGDSIQLLKGRKWNIDNPLSKKIFTNENFSLIKSNEFMSLLGLKDQKIEFGDQILVSPLHSFFGTSGLLGIIFSSNSIDDEGIRNLQIYANFAAIALANAQFIEKLEKEVQFDFLTKVFNKNAIINTLIKEIERAKRHGNPLSVIFLDIDDFKSYNDTFGHIYGDIVLERVAKIIKESIRKIDNVGRYGGEEFVVILPDTNKDGALLVAERIRKNIEDYPFPNRKVTVSLGIAFARDDDSYSSLLERADQYLYQAKRQGKNCICSE